MKKDYFLYPLSKSWNLKPIINYQYNKYRYVPTVGERYGYSKERKTSFETIGISQDF